MAELGYWDSKYFELLSFLLDEFPRDGKLIRLFADFWPALDDAGLPRPPELTETASEEYDKKTDEEKSTAWRSIIDYFGSLHPPCREHQGFKYLINRFGLTNSQLRLIEFFYLLNRSVAFALYLTIIPDQKMIAVIGKYAAISVNQLIEDLRPTGQLSLFGILSEKAVSTIRVVRHHPCVGLSDYISNYLDDTHERSLASFVLEEPALDYYALDSYDLPKETVASACAALRRQGSGFILLYGEPGTGKTELSKSLPRACGLKPYCLKGDRNNGDRPFQMLLLSARLIDPETEVMIVDEADILLNSAEPNGPRAGHSVFKALVNQFLDDARCKIIFIANQTCGIPASVYAADARPHRFQALHSQAAPQGVGTHG